MTRLLFLAACFASSLAYVQRHDMKRDGYTNSGYGGGGQGQYVHEPAGNGEVIDITYNVVDKGREGSTPVQNVAASMATSGITHEIIVGGSPGLVYTPDTIQAAVGDMVKFNFMSANHTVTQSTFANPCVKMADGHDSGFKANPDGTMSPPPSFTFQVKDTKPTWFYCRQKTHCGKGMTFSINPTANKTQAAFKALAMQQNGTMTGGAGSYTATPSPPASVPPPAASPASAPPPANLAAPSAGSVVSGSGGGECSCSCFCGVAAFPPGTGVGMFGGIPGLSPIRRKALVIQG
ncbi:hypothetical protein MMC07_004942 [Pseudocyphellaria aurata]|nr:hypothetical protein [Pseudocyphellaria aurata]